jgi:hypothetical protein
MLFVKRTHNVTAAMATGENVENNSHKLCEQDQPRERKISTVGHFFIYISSSAPLPTLASTLRRRSLSDFNALLALSLLEFTEFCSTFARSFSLKIKI